MTQWYGGFNHVRTAFLKEHGVFDGLVPASTGIGGRNISGAALTAALFAVKAGRGAATAMAIPSPLQCPALDYGSSFSRAVELETGGLRRLFVSGAASIGIDGRSVHIGRVDAQVALTMDVVRAILDSRKMDWGKVTRAIAYFKHNKDAPAFDRYCTLQGIRDMPVLLANNDICRDDLLFEIEVDAVAEA
jgi:enamine deaminase RidA (YjgF/YER057c/UK114 family)